MKRMMLVLLVAILLGVVGCGDNREQGKNKDLDKPKSADKNE